MENVKEDVSLLPKKDDARNVGPIDYIFMWIGDGVNLGNMTLGSSIIVAGIATLNMLQTFVASLIASRNIAKIEDAGLAATIKQE